jgi:hypothetical protein
MPETPVERNLAIASFVGTHRMPSFLVVLVSVNFFLLHHLTQRVLTNFEQRFASRSHLSQSKVRDISPK